MGESPESPHSFTCGELIRYIYKDRLGIDTPLIYTDADEETLKLDRIADNKVQELTKWDAEMLASELASISIDFDFSTLNLKIDLPSFDTPTRDSSSGAAGSVPILDSKDGDPDRVNRVSERDIIGEGAGGEDDEFTAEEDEFISQNDIDSTVKKRKNDYIAVTCDKCGHRLFISR